MSLRLLEILGAFLGEGRDFFFPYLCWSCASPFTVNPDPDPLGQLFCGPCDLQITRIGSCACRRCGQPGLSDPRQCRRCHGGFPGFSSAAAGARYGGLVRELVLRLKFSGQESMAFPLGLLALQGARQATRGQAPDCIVPVPLHPKRLRQRGYNQAERIARTVSDALGLPLLQGVVRRQRYTASQGSGGGGARKENVRGAFTAVEPGGWSYFKGELPARAVAGAHVLLIDDVLSTGATLDHCGRVLLQAGACSVVAAAAAT